MVGDALNVNRNNWADDVSIAYSGGQPYVAWTEHNSPSTSQLFVKTLSGSHWVLSGSGPLNKSTTTGWAFRPSLVADAQNGNLYLGWVEQQALGQRAQAYVSQFRNGACTALGTSLKPTRPWARTTDQSGRCGGSRLRHGAR
jgi:hypothetical protein